jgi:hypothetical protein
MRTALGRPLQNISSSILNKIVTKDVQMNLRKYKMGAGGRTPSKDKRNKSARKGESDGEGFASPAGAVRFADARRGRSVGNGDNSLAQNRALRQHLKDLDTGIGDKISLLKMLVLKSDEAD